METNLKKVSELQDEKYHLVVDSQDIKDTLEQIGYKDEFDQWGCLFVSLQKDSEGNSNGHYEEVWAIESNVPYTHYTAERLYPEESGNTNPMTERKSLQELKYPDPNKMVACSVCKKEFANKDMQYHNDEYGNKNDKIVNWVEYKPYCSACVPQGKSNKVAIVAKENVKFVDESLHAIGDRVNMGGADNADNPLDEEMEMCDKCFEPNSKLYPCKCNDKVEKICHECWTKSGMPPVLKEVTLKENAGAQVKKDLEDAGIDNYKIEGETQRGISVEIPLPKGYMIELNVDFYWSEWSYFIYNPHKIKIKSRVKSGGFYDMFMKEFLSVYNKAYSKLYDPTESNNVTENVIKEFEELDDDYPKESWVCVKCGKEQSGKPFDSWYDPVNKIQKHSCFGCWNRKYQKQADPLAYIASPVSENQNHYEIAGPNRSDNWIIHNISKKIDSLRTTLKSKAKSKGLWENFGQEQVMWLKDEYLPKILAKNPYNVTTASAYGYGRTSESYWAEKLIDEFDEWCQNFDLSQLNESVNGIASNDRSGSFKFCGVEGTVSDDTQDYLCDYKYNISGDDIHIESVAKDGNWHHKIDTTKDEIRNIMKNNNYQYTSGLGTWTYTPDEIEEILQFKNNDDFELVMNIYQSAHKSNYYESIEKTGNDSKSKAMLSIKSALDNRQINQKDYDIFKNLMNSDVNWQDIKEECSIGMPTWYGFERFLVQLGISKSGASAIDTYLRNSDFLAQI